MHPQRRSNELPGGGESKRYLRQKSPQAKLQTWAICDEIGSTAPYIVFPVLPFEVNGNSCIPHLSLRRLISARCYCRSACTVHPKS